MRSRNRVERRKGLIASRHSVHEVDSRTWGGLGSGPYFRYTAFRAASGVFPRSSKHAFSYLRCSFSSRRGLIRLISDLGMRIGDPLLSMLPVSHILYIYRLLTPKSAAASSTVNSDRL